MFGDSIFDEEDRLRRSEEHSGDYGSDDDSLDNIEDVMAAGGLDERLRRRQAVVQLLREIGGC